MDIEVRKQKTGPKSGADKPKECSFLCKHVSRFFVKTKHHFFEKTTKNRLSSLVID